MMIETLPIIGISIWQVVKIFILFGLGLYLVFSFVVVRQVYIMTTTLDLGFEDWVKTLAFAHLFFAIGVFVLALIIL